LGKKLEVLKKVEKTHWGVDEEIEPFFEDGYVVDGVRFSWRPRVLCTPRPYLEDNLGRWRKTYILGPENDVGLRDWEEWPTLPETAWHAELPKGTVAMATVFASHPAAAAEEPPQVFPLPRSKTPASSKGPTPATTPATGPTPPMLPPIPEDSGLKRDRGADVAGAESAKRLRDDEVTTAFI
jgi:hypothetical protein